MARKKVIMHNTERYRAEFWVPSKNTPRSYQLKSECHSASRKKLIRIARKGLGSITATRYTRSRELERCGYVRIIDAWSARAITITPEVIIVPSVGELGYW